MFRKKPQAPKLQGQALLDALIEAEQAHGKALKGGKGNKRKRNQGSMWLADWPSRLKTLATVVGIVLAALILDGVRRENAELHAVLTLANGRVNVVPDGKGAEPAKMGMTLSDRDIVATGPKSAATVTFPDGSVIELEPNTRFEVRTLDFARGGRRDRSFMVHAGAVFARFSHYFGAGAGSEGTVCTPTAVAAVRGTGFRVVYDRSQRLTYIAVVEGRVVLRTAGGETQSNAGQVGTAAGYDLRPAQPLAADTRQRMSLQVRRADQYVKAPSWLQQVEFGLNSFLDPVLQVLGITPGTWSYGMTNYARTATCQEALRKLQQDIESHDNPPKYVNLVTLEELGIDPQRRDQILNTFQGKMLQSYSLQGSRYVVRVRARDRARTLFELTPNGTRVVKQ